MLYREHIVLSQDEHSILLFEIIRLHEDMERKHSITIHLYGMMAIKLSHPTIQYVRILWCNYHVLWDSMIVHYNVL